MNTNPTPSEVQPYSDEELREIRAELAHIRVDGHSPLPWRGDSGDGVNDAKGMALLSPEEVAMFWRTTDLWLAVLAVNHCDRLLATIAARDEEIERLKEIEEKSCIKCGGRDINVLWKDEWKTWGAFDKVTEHPECLRHTCRCCHYQWDTPTLDAPTPPTDGQGEK